MSILDKAIAAVTPPVSDEKRAEAHAKARAVAEPLTKSIAASTGPASAMPVLDAVLASAD